MIHENLDMLDEPKMHVETQSLSDSPVFKYFNYVCFLNFRKYSTIADTRTIAPSCYNDSEFKVNQIAFISIVCNALACFKPQELRFVYYARITI